LILIEFFVCVFKVFAFEFVDGNFW